MNRQLDLPVDLEISAAHAELNMFSMSNTIYRDLVCRANGGTLLLVVPR